MPVTYVPIWQLCPGDENVNVQEHCGPGVEPRGGHQRQGTRHLHFVQSTFRPKVDWGHVKNCRRKSMVNLSSSLTYPDQNYPYYRLGLRTKSRLRTRITRILITNTDPDYKSKLRISFCRSGLRNKDRDNFGHDRLEMDKDLPHFYTDNFSRDAVSNDRPA